MASVWDRLPVVVRAVLQGLAVAAVGILPWPILVQANLATSPDLPWAAPLGLGWTGALLWWLSGRGAPRSTARTRRRLSRLAPPGAGLWRLALVSGAFYALGLAGLRVIGWMLFATDVSVLADIRAAAALPATTAVPLLLVGAGIAGVVEEAGFRGYMQVPLEKRYRPAVAIGIVALLFALFHFPGPAVLPVFALAASGWGILAWGTGSLLPGMILHAALDAGFWLWSVRDVEAIEELLRASVFEDGATPAFWIVIAATGAAWAVAAVGFVRLARRRRAGALAAQGAPPAA